jgi:hypothetical protein
MQHTKILSFLSGLILLLIASAYATPIQTVWVIDSKKNLHFRNGITPQNSLGADWEKIDANISHVAAGSSGTVWAITADKKLVFREGITPSSPIGNHWKEVETKTGIVGIAIGGPNDTLMWAWTGNNDVYRRVGITAENPTGTAWKNMPGLKARSITIGPDGDIWHLGRKWQPFQFLYIKIYRAREAAWDMVLQESIDCKKILLKSGEGMWVLISTKGLFHTYYQLLFHSFTESGKKLALQPSTIITDKKFSDIATNAYGPLRGITLQGDVIVRQGDSWSKSLGKFINIAVGSIEYKEK